MTIKTLGNVRYFLNGVFYTVGDNSTTIADGIADASYSGEIVIEDRINGKEVLEIAQQAFNGCRITKVTIYAKLRNLNWGSFYDCPNLEYINIPETVTYIGNAVFNLPETIDFTVTFEFNEGRTQGLYIGAYSFPRRKTVYIIYPSDIIPSYYAMATFYEVTNAFICAYSSFTFCSKRTTTNSSKCPVPQFNERTEIKTKAYKVCFLLFHLYPFIV